MKLFSRGCPCILPVWLSSPHTWVFLLCLPAGVAATRTPANEEPDVALRIRHVSVLYLSEWSRAMSNLRQPCKSECLLEFRKIPSHPQWTLHYYSNVMLRGGRKEERTEREGIEETTNERMLFPELRLLYLKINVELSPFSLFFLNTKKIYI